METRLERRTVCLFTSQLTPAPNYAARWETQCVWTLCQGLHTNETAIVVVIVVYLYSTSHSASNALLVDDKKDSVQWNAYPGHLQVSTTEVEIVHACHCSISHFLRLIFHVAISPSHTERTLQKCMLVLYKMQIYTLDQVFSHWWIFFAVA